MPTYYPSQGSHRSHHGHSNSAYYSQPSQSHHHGANVVYVPTQGSSHSHRRHDRYYGTPQVVSTNGMPVIMQPSSHSHSHGHGHGHDHGHGHRHRRHRSLGERIRHFFGLAPTSDYRYKSNNSSWGFLGRSSRPRYVDARTGADVDKHGRQIYRV